MLNTLRAKESDDLLLVRVESRPLAKVRTRAELRLAPLLVRGDVQRGNESPSYLALAILDDGESGGNNSNIPLLIRQHPLECNTIILRKFHDIGIRHSLRLSELDMLVKLGHHVQLGTHALCGLHQLDSAAKKKHCMFFCQCCHTPSTSLLSFSLSFFFLSQPQSLKKRAPEAT